MKETFLGMKRYNVELRYFSVLYYGTNHLSSGMSIKLSSTNITKNCAVLYTHVYSSDQLHVKQYKMATFFNVNVI